MSGLAYCGMNCATCPSYTTTVHPDVDVLKKVEADSQAAGGLHWVCLGCTPKDQPVLAKYCATCDIRDCAIAKKVDNCAACDDFESCSRLRDFLKADNAQAIAKRMQWLRQRFLALRLERDTARWRSAARKKPAAR